MSRKFARLFLALVMTVFVAGVYAPTPADAQVVVRVGPHHRHHHRRAYYRHGHRYYR